MLNQLLINFYNYIYYLLPEKNNNKILKILPKPQSDY